MKNYTEKAYNILKTYNGENNQIRYLQYKVEKTNYILSDFDEEYVINNCDYIPFEVNKTVGISSDYGEKLKEKYELEFIPEKVKIYRIIGEMGNSYHCYMQFRKSVEPTLAYIRKNYILNPIENPTQHDNIPIEIDFSKYEKKRKLKQTQKDAVEFLVKNKRCILADSMGLGKTSSATVAALASGSKKILVISPASVKSTWKREISYFEDESEVTIISGSKWETNTKFTIVNYDILDNFYKVAYEDEYIEETDEDGNVVKIPKLTKTSSGKVVQKQKKTLKKDVIKKCLEESPLFLEEFDCLIIDEAHKLSNNKSIRYSVIYDFIRKSKIPYVFMLTGTPLTNKPMNLYHLLKLIDAEVTRDYNYYVKRYCGGREMKLKDGRKILIAKDATNLNELKEKIKHIYIRRLLSDMTDMVNKEVLINEYDLNPKQQKIYRKLWDEYTQAQLDIGNDDSESYRQLVEGIIVRQYLAKEMTENTIEIVDQKLEEDEKVIIVCTFQEEMDIFKKYYGKSAVIYNGKMTPKQKDKAEYEFMNNPKIKVFIGNLQAAGVGLTLTISNFMVFNSYSWVAAENLQMQDRIYRITQTRDVTCVYQLYTDSISRDMFDKVMRKQIMMNDLIKSENEK